MRKNKVATIIPTATIAIDPIHNTITYNRDYIKKNVYSNVTSNTIVALNNKLNSTELNNKHRYILDNVVASCEKSIKDAFFKLLDSNNMDAKKAGELHNKITMLTISKKHKYITKARVMEVWDYYLDDTPISKIAEYTSLTNKEVNRIIVNQFRPVHPRYMGKKYSDQDIVNYNYIKTVYTEIIRRCRIKLYHNTRMLSEKRHHEAGLPWGEAIVTPLEYISTDPILAKIFKEIAAQYKEAIRTQKIKTLK